MVWWKFQVALQVENMEALFRIFHNVAQPMKHYNTIHCLVWRTKNSIPLKNVTYQSLTCNWFKDQTQIRVRSYSHITWNNNKSWQWSTSKSFGWWMGTTKTSLRQKKNTDHDKVHISSILWKPIAIVKNPWMLQLQ